MLSLNLGHLLHECLAASQEAGHLLLVFLSRHWLVGLANACVTALAGLALLWLASRLWPLRNHPGLVLHLRRIVYLIALFKGAIYLVVGDNLTIINGPIGCGGQLAPLSFLDVFDWRARYSLWHPTSATLLVTLVLCGLALGLLLWRAYRVANSSGMLVSLDRLCGQADPRAEEALRRAAAALRLGPNVALPKILLVEVDCATPLLLGILQPRLLLSPKLLNELTADELELALRHELAHLKRKDHWWRWIQLWAEDVGRPTLFAGRLGAWSVEVEELLCDRLAVLSPQDANFLGHAITKAARLLTEQVTAGAYQVNLNDTVVPALLGKHRLATSEQKTLQRRVGELLRLSHELADKPQPQPSAPKFAFALSALRISANLLGLLVIAFLLFGVLYAKFIFLLNIR